LAANNYWVEDAPGSCSGGFDIWFNIGITCLAGHQVDYVALGMWVEETGQFQKSRTDQHFMWRDHINISGGGIYHLWLRICFTNLNCVNMLGPIQVEVH